MDTPAPTLSSLAIKTELRWRATDLVLKEREEQELAHGYSSAQDDTYKLGELGDAAIAYVLRGSPHPVTHRDRLPLHWWPWESKTYKPSTPPFHALVKAGAFILAEIERRLRAGETE